jgi:hypothetical protein
MRKSVREIMLLNMTLLKQALQVSATELKTNKQRVYVVEYKLTVVSTGGKEEFTGTGNKITEPMRFAFHNASSHAKINFENIKCINKDGSTYLLAPLSLELK